MAFVPVSDRVVGNRGSLKQETGTFTDVSGGDYQIQTTVGAILFFKVQALGTADNNSVDMTYNSLLDAGAEDDPGVMHIETGTDSGENYSYLAIGRGG